MDHRSQVIMAAVLGAGVVIGTAGVFIFNQLFGQQRQRLAHQDTEIRKLNQTVVQVRAELEELRTRRFRRRTEGDSDDMFSAIGTDDEDDEFYDLSDDEETEQEQFETEPLLINLFSRVDEKMNGTNEERAWSREQMLEHLEAFPDNGGLLWRLAKCNYTQAKTEPDPDIQLVLKEQGLNFARRAVEAEPRSSDTNKWYAVMVGQQAESLGMKDRIQQGVLFKKHVDLALSLAPNDALLHFLAGRFKFEVASLSWYERKVAAMVFGELPTATFDEALTHFTSAEKLNDGPWRENRLMLAKTCAALDDFTQALYWLNLSLNSPYLTDEDADQEKEARLLISKYMAKQA